MSSVLKETQTNLQCKKYLVDQKLNTKILNIPESISATQTHQTVVSCVIDGDGENLLRSSYGNDLATKKKVFSRRYNKNILYSSLLRKTHRP